MTVPASATSEAALRGEIGARHAVPSRAGEEPDGVVEVTPAALASPDTTPPYVEVALALPLFQTFTYSVESPPSHPLVPGTRVIVPFRSRRVVGICVRTSDTPPPRGTPKPILDVPDRQPALDEHVVALCRWMAEYYAVPFGVAVRAALPAALTDIVTVTPLPKTRRVAMLTQVLPSLLHRERLFARAPRQREAYEYLEAAGGRVPVDHLVKQLGCAASVVRGLVERGVITIVDQAMERDPFAARPIVTPVVHTPSPAQRAAIAALTAATPGDVFLLHGITGSGKTLVYIEFLRRVVEERGQTAIVLVPEIALTPQTVDRFRAVFGDRVAVLHSMLNDGERYDAWAALRTGRKRIAVGARSAVFAPLPNLGAIIVDEEHEASYKQGEAPRYHAREIAVMRARHAGAVTVLGSATPSLESWVNGTSGKYHYLTLPDRVGGGRIPEIAVVDLRAPAVTGHRGGAPAAPARIGRNENDATGTPSHVRREGREGGAGIITEALDDALRTTLERREQSILLLNRRGYAAFVQCAACGEVTVCPHCSITLTYHRAPERMVCHYCQHQEPVHAHCARCGAATLRRRGLGTQQVERVVTERFPSARVARMDVDTTGAKWAHAEILDRVGRGEVDILLGTQMIAKGLDFPNVTLVGVIDADVGINLPDFRASERCFQLLSQVAGRAGRGPKGGRVLIQTRVPSHHAVRCAVAHDYTAFAAVELAGRGSPLYPPLVRLANAVFSGLAEAPTAALAERGADWLRRLAARNGGDGIQVIGPAPCPIERIKTRWRWHVLLKADHAAPLTRLAQYFVRRFPIPSTHGLRMAWDRDPVALL